MPTTGACRSSRPFVARAVPPVGLALGSRSDHRPLGGVREQWRGARARRGRRDPEMDLADSGHLRRDGDQEHRPGRIAVEGAELARPTVTGVGGPPCHVGHLRPAARREPISIKRPNAVGRHLVFHPNLRPVAPGVRRARHESSIRRERNLGQALRVRPDRRRGDSARLVVRIRPRGARRRALSGSGPLTNRAGPVMQRAETDDVERAGDSQEQAAEHHAAAHKVAHAPCSFALHAGSRRCLGAPSVPGAIRAGCRRRSSALEPLANMVVQLSTGLFGQKAHPATSHARIGRDGHRTRGERAGPAVGAPAMCGGRTPSCAPTGRARAPRPGRLPRAATARAAVNVTAGSPTRPAICTPRGSLVRTGVW